MLDVLDKTTDTREWYQIDKKPDYCSLGIEMAAFISCWAGVLVVKRQKKKPGDEHSDHTSGPSVMQQKNNHKQSGLVHLKRRRGRLL